MGNKPIREYARQLGLRVINNGARLAFDEGSFGPEAVVHSMWREITNARIGVRPSYIRKSLHAVLAIVNKYGERVWGSRERAHLLVVGEFSEYDVDLYWERRAHREKILGIFAELYKDSDSKKDSSEKTPSISGKKRQRSSAESPDREDTVSSSDLYSIASSALESSDRKKTRTVSPEEVNIEPDLLLTTLWVKNSANDFTAELLVGTLTTIPLFFQGIRDAFLAQNKDKMEMIMAKGAMQKIKIMFWNLGNRMQMPLTLDPRTPSAVFTKFRNDLAYALTDHREPKYGEEILCIGTVLFEKDHEQL